MKRSRKPPSALRYEVNNPIVGCNIPKRYKDQIEEIVSKHGGSVASFCRSIILASLDGHQELTLEQIKIEDIRKEAYSKGFKRGVITGYEKAEDMVSDRERELRDDGFLKAIRILLELNTGATKELPQFVRRYSHLYVWALLEKEYISRSNLKLYLDMLGRGGFGDRTVGECFGVEE